MMIRDFFIENIKVRDPVNLVQMATKLTQFATEHCYSDLFSLESHVFTRAILHSLPYQKNRSRENRAEKERSS